MERSIFWRLLDRMTGVDLRKAIVNTVAASWFVSPARRRRFLCWYGVDMGDAVIVFPGCVFGGQNIEIGAGAFINRGVVLENSARITIGKHVAVGLESALITSNHHQGPADHRAMGLRPEPISIGDGCWLGARVVVMPGVTIGGGCIIGAGSIVTSHCEPSGVYVGAPARRVRDLIDQPTSSGSSA